MQSPHMYMLMRSRASPMLTNSLRNGLAVRGGGGGHWPRPDPRPYGMVPHTRRIHLEDINTSWYGDFGPEFYLHLHSIQIQHSKQGLFLITVYFFAVILPVWLCAR